MRQADTAEVRKLWEEVVVDFDDLLESYRAAGWIDSSPARPDDQVATQFQRIFWLSDGLWRHAVGRALFPSSASPPHVVVFGGTQVGKSTVVNLLLGRNAARVYHTAGFTRNAYAFISPSTEAVNLFAGNPHTFKRLERVEPDQLDAQNPHAWTAQLVEHQKHLLGTVVWDTPDCDSVGSREYMRGMVEAVTNADVLVYVTSREKYAVNLILEWLALLIDAGIPVTCVLNMTPLAQQDEIIASMRSALTSVQDKMNLSHSECADVTALEFLPAEKLRSLHEADGDFIRKLRQSAVSIAAARNSLGAERATAASEFVRSRLPEILRPANLELSADDQWNQMIGSSVSLFTESYQREFLDDPDRYDAFRRVGLEILTLLDPPVPGLKKTITTVRQVLGLPARMIVGAVKAAARVASAEPEKQPANPQDQTYRSAHQKVLNRVSREIAEQRSRADHHAFWDQADKAWSQRIQTLDLDFAAHMDRHQQASNVLIRETAQKIYAELAKSPVKLNLLRTGRIGADAAAIVISIKTGGQGDIVHDLVLAPILMSIVQAVTQQLTESYMAARQEELRAQLAQSTEDFSREFYGTALGEIRSKSFEESSYLTLSRERIESLPGRIDKVVQALHRL